MVLAKINSSQYPGQEDYLFFCPGCRCGHVFTTKWNADKIESRKRTHKENWRPPVWTFNGNMEKPTFRASLLITTEAFEDVIPATTCHLFLTDGIIEFLSDCTHGLKGQKVPLPQLNVSY